MFDRSICLWSTNKKKPIFTFTLAHGLEEIESSTEGTLRRPRWVTSLAALRYGDVFASGMSFPIVLSGRSKDLWQAHGMVISVYGS